MHTAKLQNDTIQLAFNGDITKENIVPIAKKCVTYATLLEDKGKPVNLLVDYTKLGERKTDSTPFSSMAMRDVNISKYAAYGLNEQATKEFAKMVEASGKTDKVRVFATKKEAEDWLGL